jgi:ATP-dependent Clp protease ATP-binding subunit ClpA
MFFTSNLGYSDAQQGTRVIGYLDDEARQVVDDQGVRRSLREQLKPEFINRVRTVHFNRLGQDSVERVLDLEFDRIARRYRDLHGLQLVLDGTARAELIRRGFSASFGARHLASTLEAACNVDIAKKILQENRAPLENRTSLIGWLREIRSGKRVFKADEVRERVMGLARAEVGYGALRIGFRDGAFVYEALADEDGE